MNITLNGLAESLAAKTTVAGLVDAMALPPRGIAIAVNGEVVRSAAWPAVLLGEGDVVDVVTARQGG